MKKKLSSPRRRRRRSRALTRDARRKRTRLRIQKQNTPPPPPATSIYCGSIAAAPCGLIAWYDATRFIALPFSSASSTASTLHTRFIPATLPCGTCAPTSTISVYCLFVTANALPRILPAACSASSSSTKRMSNVR
eukprot:31180-Pelagococcus_subviridis.AAC.2